MTTQDPDAEGSVPWSPGDYATAARWTNALKSLAANVGQVRCPANDDGDLAVTWHASKSQSVRPESVSDVVCFVWPRSWWRSRRLPNGRHEVRCPTCGEVRYLVVTANPS